MLFKIRIAVNYIFSLLSQTTNCIINKFLLEEKKVNKRLLSVFSGILSILLVIVSIISCASSMPVEADSNTGIVASYDFEGSGDAIADSSGNNLDGVISGGGVNRIAYGVIGNAVEFTADGFIDCGYSELLDLGDQMSIAFWIRSDAVGEGGPNVAPMARAEASKVWSWQIRFNAPDQIGSLGFQANATNGMKMWVSAQNKLPPGEWHYIVVTQEGLILSMYFDGELADSKEIPGIKPGSSKLLLGNDGWNNIFTGAIDEVRIYNRPLVPEEIKLHYDTYAATALTQNKEITIISALTEEFEPTAAEDFKIISYIRTWPLGSTLADMSAGEHWSAADINGEKLSTLNIAFGHIVNGTDIKIEDVETGEDGVAGFASLFDEIAALRAAYPDLRINLSIGGWGADGFSDMAFTAETRAAFVDNVIKWIVMYNLSGVDIDWEYPVGGGAIKSRPEDKENFTALMIELRTALDTLDAETDYYYELSFAAAASASYLTWIEPEKIAEVVDYVKIMSYDFYGGWSGTTGHHANLYRNSQRMGDNSVASTVERFINAGFPRYKLIIGVPFYGRAFSGVPNRNSGLYQTYTQSEYPDGITFPDIQKLIEEGMVRFWDDEAKAPFLYDGDLFVTYEDPQSLAEKVKFVQENGLRGIMIWEYAHDMNNDLLDKVNESIE